MELSGVKKFYQDNFGASAVEYSIILAGIAIMIIGSIAIFGGSVKGLFVNGSGIF